MDSPQERFKARLGEGRAFAPSLVGLERQAAIERATEHGFRPEAIPTTVEAITADLVSNRIRLFLDEDGSVVRALAG